MSELRYVFEGDLYEFDYAEESIKSLTMSRKEHGFPDVVQRAYDLFKELPEIDDSEGLPHPLDTDDIRIGRRVYTTLWEKRLYDSPPDVMQRLLKDARFRFERHGMKLDKLPTHATPNDLSKLVSIVDSGVGANQHKEIKKLLQKRYVNVSALRNTIEATRRRGNLLNDAVYAAEIARVTDQYEAAMARATPRVRALHYNPTRWIAQRRETLINSLNVLEELQRANLNTIY